MLPVRDWEEDREPVEVVAEDLDILERALADAPFSEMRLYQDRVARRMKREVRLEILSGARPVRLRVRHSDPSMDALDLMLAKSRA